MGEVSGNAPKFGVPKNVEQVGRSDVADSGHAVVFR